MEDSAIPNHIDRAVQIRRAVPEIDFTLHTMEDGTQVSTQERVCKGSTSFLIPRTSLIDVLGHRCASPGLFPTNRRTVFIST